MSCLLIKMVDGIYLPWTNKAPKPCNAFKKGLKALAFNIQLAFSSFLCFLKASQSFSTCWLKEGQCPPSLFICKYEIWLKIQVWVKDKVKKHNSFLALHLYCSDQKILLSLLLFFFPASLWCCCNLFPYIFCDFFPLAKYYVTKFRKLKYWKEENSKPWGADRINLLLKVKKLSAAPPPTL